MKIYIVVPPPSKDKFYETCILNISPIFQLILETPNK